MPRQIQILAFDSKILPAVCRSDFSPDQLKLIMHESKAKYALRGETMIPSDSINPDGTPGKKLAVKKPLIPPSAGHPRPFWITPCGNGMPLWKRSSTTRHLSITLLHI
jgi:hypothetical protein